MFTELPWTCPLTGRPLAPAPPAAMPGLSWPPAADALLVTEGPDPIGYPVVDGVPILTVEAARGRAVPPSPVEAGRHEEIREEVDIYDRLAAADRARITHARRRLLGRRLDQLARRGALPGPFPDPPGVWVDSVGSADTQEAAYRHLAPLTETRFLQLGGSGSHAVKALLAGAECAGVLTPSFEEVQLGRALADSFGVGHRFFGVVAIGELIPLADGALDRVYGGGCLHHTAIEHSVPALARVLAPEGRAAFVDPLQNPIYRAWTGLAGRRARFCGDEEGTHDHPLDLDALRALAGRHFAGAEVYASGGPLRYGVVFAARALNLAPRPRTAARLFRAERAALDRLGLQRLYGNFALLLTR